MNQDDWIEVVSAKQLLADIEYVADHPRRPERYEAPGWDSTPALRSLLVALGVPNAERVSWISSKHLNELLQEAIARRPPPLPSGNRKSRRAAASKARRAR